MEQQLNRKFEEYIIKFKENIKTKLFEIEGIDIHKASEFMEYIYDYERLVFTKDDLKNKKSKNKISDCDDNPLSTTSNNTSNESKKTEKCIAILPSGQQCNKKKKKGLNYCTCHSDMLIKADSSNVTEDKNDNINIIDIFTENIGGIIYYIDKYNNVYNTEDIMNDMRNPRIIARYFPSERKGNDIENMHRIIQFNVFHGDECRSEKLIYRNEV
jgi:hypothetical protein